MIPLGCRDHWRQNPRNPVVVGQANLGRPCLACSSSSRSIGFHRQPVIGTETLVFVVTSSVAEVDGHYGVVETLIVERKDAPIIDRERGVGAVTDQRQMTGGTLQSSNDLGILSSMHEKLNKLDSMVKS